MNHPPTMATFAAWASDKHGDAIAMRYTRDDAVHEVSYRDLADRVARYAGGLARQGVRPGDRVGLLAETCPEWTYCDLAISSLGAVVVPVYPTNPEPECAWVLGNSGATLVVCGTAEHQARVPQLPSVLLSELDSDPVPAYEGEPGEPATFIYTSGTTGPAKGCVITHANWWSTLVPISGIVGMRPGSRVYLYLPLAHMFSRIIQNTAFMTGTTVCYWGGDLSRIVDELAEIRPTHLPSVPRLFEKAYARVCSMLDEEQRKTFGPAIVQGIFGGEVEKALSGGAPIQQEILEFFDTCGIPIYEAYGLTESTAIISTNRPDARKFGSVGQALPGVEVRIAEDGEVITRGAHVFAGYHANPEATANSIVDGWLHTGDLGELDSEGFLRITGRKKDLIITSGGKNLSPSNWENDLRSSRWVSQAIMYGDRRPYAVALITIDADETRDMPRSQVDELIATAVAEANSHYSPPEQVRRYAVLDSDFTVESGELTASLKVKRAIVHQRHRELFESLYTDETSTSEA